MPALPSADTFRACSIAALLFVYTVLALSFSAIHYTETLHRVTTERIFDESVFGSNLADSLAVIGFMLLFFSASFRSKVGYTICAAVFGAAIGAFLFDLGQLAIAGLATLPVLAGLLLFSALRSHKTIGADRSVFLTTIRTDGVKVAAAFLVIMIIMEVGALARWISYPIIPTEIYRDSSWRIAELESGLFHTLGLLSPIFVVLAAFSFLYRWYILDILQRVSHRFQGSQKTRPAVTTPKKNRGGNIGNGNWNKPSMEHGTNQTPLIAKQIHVTQKTKVIPTAVLSAAFIIAPLLMIYPHVSTVNPAGGGISADEQYYLNWATMLRANEHLGGVQVVADAFTINQGDRPLTLLLITGIANVISVPDLMVIRYLPVALAPALVASSYLLVRHTLGPRNDRSVSMFAALAALVTAFSPQVVVGQYAGLLANWLGLVAGFFALFFMIRAWESSDRRGLAMYSTCLLATLLLVMLFHLYTWSHLVVVTLVFCGISYAFSRKKTGNPEMKLLVLILVAATSFAIDYGRSLYFGTEPLAGSDSVLIRNVLAEDPSSRWDQLYYTLGTNVGGFLSNPVLFLLALVWLTTKFEMTKGLDRVLIAMFFIITLPLLLGTVEFQTRVLHNTPVQIPAILAVYSLGGQSRYPMSRILLIIAIIAVMATFAFRAMANLYLELPEGFELSRRFLLR